MSFVSKFLGAAAAVLLLVPSVLSAHVHWTQVNSVNADTLALYHFDEHHAAVGDAIEPDAGITTPGLDLIVGSTAGTGSSAVHDTPDTIFDPHGLKLTSTQDLATTGSLAGTDSDVTVEFWFKWDATVTSQTLTLGLQSTASIVLARDINVPANDKFGVSFTHGDYVSAPGFTNWVDAGSEEAGLDEWRHYAVTIHSTGMTFDIPSGHDLYNPGSTATFWLNGHATGTAPHTVAINGKKAHDASKVRIRNVGGTVYVDEFTIWKKDWSQNGTVSNPFANGRGAAPSAVSDWVSYE